jgi:hypothetical protein
LKGLDRAKEIDMATEQPNIAPDDVKPEPDDAESAATILDDAQMTKTPGGGGDPTREAQLRSLNDGPKEPHTNPN